MSTLFTNIGKLYGIQEGKPEALSGSSLAQFNAIDNAWMLVEGGRIKDYGPMSNKESADEKIDLKGRIVLPGYCDSHTHLVFAEPRSGEFEDRIRGLSYEEIANRGGGILNSAEKLRQMSEDDLFEGAKTRLAQVIQQGTTCIEIKSGYGLSTESELKMLRVIHRLKALEWIPIKSTFLAAHALPKEFKDNKSGYLDLVVNEMLPQVAENGLADYIDIFCEKGYFGVDDTERILQAGLEHGIKAKIHVNQFNVLGGVKKATELGAISVDHLEFLEDDDINALRSSDTIATALPSCSFFLNIPYTPVRKLIDADIPLALATDFNPGSTPSGNMSFVVSLACIHQKMLPSEAFNAATINGAAALELAHETGSISKGKLANFMVMKDIPNLSFIPYSFGDQLVDEVYVNGRAFSF